MEEWTVMKIEQAGYDDIMPSSRESRAWSLLPLLVVTLSVLVKLRAYDEHAMKMNMNNIAWHCISYRETLFMIVIDWRYGSVILSIYSK